MTKARDRRLLPAAIMVVAAGIVSQAAGTDHPGAPDPAEAHPGGAATSRGGVADRNAFSHASGNLDVKREFDFKIGNAIFRKLWVSAPASTTASDGVGPLYNARACQSCHLKDGRGHPPAANWPEDDAMSMLLRLSIPPQTEEQRRLLAEHRIAAVPEPVYGGQLQDLAVQGHAAEGKIHVTYEERTVALAGGETVRLRRPHYRIDHLGYGPLHPDTMLSPRIAPQMIGLGLLELVPEADILANADPHDADGDGISGRAQHVWSLTQGRVALGRFGHKAGAPTIAQQTAEAFAGDIGISSPMIRRPSGDCTPAQTRCLSAPNGNTAKYQDAEIGTQLFDLVVFYARNLAVPRRRRFDDPQVLKGRTLFRSTGCAACHRPRFVTGHAPDQPHLSGQEIWPYTDLLLHDMGEGLADHRPEGAASGREWRTAPLWGIGLTDTVNGAGAFLHDGRARSLTEAILWHGGEAQDARDAFAALPKEDRDRLIAFVTSL